jgi:transmembrane sensor
MTHERLSGEDEREDQAIAWLVRLNSGEAGADDWRGLEAWLAADEANLAALTRVEAIWGELDDHAYPLKQALDARDDGRVVPFTPHRRRARRATTAWPRLAAAALAVLVVGGASFSAWRAMPSTYQTAPGEIRHIALSDGTRIDLNGASRLDVRMAHDARRVQLADAEAAFDVTHDPHRPFLITAGDERIRVVGTAFDVSHHDGRFTVTVRRGVVEVSRPGVSGEAGQVVRVPAGYQLERRDGQPDAAAVAVDPEEALAWRGRRLIYHDRPLRDVAADLARAFATPIAISPTAADLRFSGVLVLDNEDAVVARLAAFLPVEVDRTDAKIVLNSKR